uniref:DUF4278 domain-containing protein n=1 Tax=Planktothricoides sp. SpSt-374 TaxID=2282167 RepID=A0A7C3VGX5_9CYAN
MKNDMKLNYRGTKYDYDPPTIEMMEGPEGGLYRGCSWHTRYPRHMTAPQSVEILKYRGIAYNNGATAPTSAPKREPASTKAGSGVFTSQTSKDMWAEVAKIHEVNICRNLERRLQAAEQRGDQKLIEMLKKEWEQLTCAIS